jgi:very-short-patch-repair endonuclease
MGEGRTHPHSAGEAKLSKALTNDTELCLLFSANRPVETIYRNRPTVDLLWPEGRVVVEIDGHDHRTPQKYAADRRRDFELGISDYYVLRLLNEEIMTDTAKAIAQIREVVRYRRQTRPDLGRRL